MNIELLKKYEAEQKRYRLLCNECDNCYLKIDFIEGDLARDLMNKLNNSLGKEIKFDVNSYFAYRDDGSYLTKVLLFKVGVMEVFSSTEVYYNVIKGRSVNEIVKEHLTYEELIEFLKTIEK